ncbi:ammonium transporter [Synechococcus sp. PCC 7335]|uniref:ammonium transporter n=1 Tax=Synechococcus sp. (strain ATCC 29403 / PCC 7335) TaxID=91464 RepID=UPI0012F940FD
MSNFTMRKRKYPRRSASPWDANVPPFTEMASRALSRAFGRRFAWGWLACIPLAFTIVATWGFAAHAQEVTADDVQIVLDNIWIVVAAILVIFMNAGFGMLETGFCRQKNAVNILAKNLIVFALATLSFWALGFALAFGEGNGLFGLSGFFLAGSDPTEPVFGTLTTPVFFLFQAAFAGTAATIVSGAVAERVKFSSFIVFSVLLTAISYPISAHWVWGGGWLSDMSFLGEGVAFSDFAGSTVVHSVGGWAALMGAIFLGPRIGKYQDGAVNAIPGHNMSIATLGCLILWIGWFGFNPGSELAASLNVPQIALVTNLAAAAGGIGATFTAWSLSGKPDLSMVINGILAGLVGITAGCGGIGYWGAVIVGLIAGIIVVFSVGFFDSIKIDDPVGATSVHLVCGIWGTLAVGLFDGEAGLFFGGGITQLIAQIIGIVAIGLFTVVVTGILWVIIKSLIGLRVSSEEELKGLDIGEHGMEAYSGFLKDTSDMGGII